MIRTIHPVGQGAFYTEKFYFDSNNTYTIIYDCGSITPFSGPGQLIDSEITQTFDKDEDITAIFISHFHKDHINGIKKLLEFCNVKYVFLPVLTNASKLLLMAYEDDNEILKFINNPSEYINTINQDDNHETKIIFIEEENPEEQHNQNDSEEDEEKFFLDRDYEKTDEHIIKSGTKITFSHYDKIWKYIPYNFRYDDLYAKIIGEYYKRKLPIPNAALISDDPNKLEEAKKIFDNVIKSNKRNINSMVLYSGSDMQKKWTCHAFINCYRNCISNYFDKYYYRYFKTGCLYLGDYDLTEKDAFDLLIKKYRHVENNITLVQVPHHGSKHNFNDRICCKFADSKIFFISAGEKNQYRHPSRTVFEKIFFSHNYVCLVTENKSSTIQFIYTA